MVSNQLFIFKNVCFTRKYFVIFTIAILSALFVSAEIQAGVPAGFTQTNIIKSLNNPTRMAIAPDGRIFITEQAGRIKIVEKGHLLAQPFLNIATRVNSQGER